MLIYEYKVRLCLNQRQAIDAAIRTTQFIRNKALRRWMDGQSVGRADLQALCADLAQEFPFAATLNSMARQAAADRAWQAIARFYENCQKKRPGKQGYPKGYPKGYPQFQKDNRSVEYKTSGWKLERDGKRLTFTDRMNIGTVRLVGTRAIETFPVGQIKRVRLVKRADGYYVQFAVQAERQMPHTPTGSAVGIDVGLKVFLTDSNGGAVANPRYLRKAEQQLKRFHRRVSRKKQGSRNRTKARQHLAKGYLKVSRQRKDFAAKTAKTLIQSHDVVAYEDLKITHLVRNRQLAKSISDAAWGIFLGWLRYYGKIATVPVVAVPPAYTSQECSGVLPDGTRCQTRVQKTLSMRTHVCPRCGLVLDRDENAARNILVGGQRLLAAS